MRFNRELPLKSKICVVNLMHILSTKKTHEFQTIQISPKWRLFRMKHSLKWTWGMLICILKSKWYRNNMKQFFHSNNYRGFITWRIFNSRIVSSSIVLTFQNLLCKWSSRFFFNFLCDCADSFFSVSFHFFKMLIQLLITDSPKIFHIVFKHSCDIKRIIYMLLIIICYVRVSPVNLNMRRIRWRSDWARNYSV